VNLEVWGSPIEHSLSPAIHNAAFGRSAIDASFGLREVDAQSLSAQIDDVRSGRNPIVGLSATMPLKQQLLELCDDVDHVARGAGGVNAVRIERDQAGNAARLVGTSTDGAGFCNGMRAQGVSLGGARVQLIGAGGSAQAIAVSLLSQDIEALSVVNRDSGRATDLVKVLSDQDTAVELALSVDLDADIVVFCVPRDAESGLFDSLDLLRGEPTIVSLSYGLPTPPSRDAAQLRGWRHIDGIAMLVAQAELAYAHWFALPAPDGAYRPPAL
jgi:shikimate dehydrogenase